MSIKLILQLFGLQRNKLNFFKGFFINLFQNTLFLKEFPQGKWLFWVIQQN